MVSLINHTQIPKFCQPFSRLHYPLIPHLQSFHNIKRRHQNYMKVSLITRSLGFVEIRRTREFESTPCKHSEGEIELEAEIMEFMEKSEKPSMFPTKKELIEAGRMDLVEAIKREGGWYSLGWGEDNVQEGMDAENCEFQKRVEISKESATLREQCADFLPGHEQQQEEDGLSFEIDPGCDNSKSLQLTSVLSSGPSIGLDADEDAGIDGILSRLEKQRNVDLGFDLGKYWNGTPFRSTHPDYDDHFDTSEDVGTNLGEDSGLMSSIHQKIKITRNIEPKDWRTWSSQRAGCFPLQFEAAEISFRKIQLERDKENPYDGKALTNEEHSGTWKSTKEINLNHIQTRLQHLEFEINTALGSLRSKRDKSMSEEVIGAMGSSGDLYKLSDAWEFQENEFMSAQERLRSVKAKLAVLEGKRALAIINSQKTVDEKQKRIDNARKAFQLLRTTFIEWPNSASEVLLVGSFDGWTTKRKMEKSRANVFSIYLKLYPGRYEIKFIVDGVWKVDPLRPIVNNGGHENNLLIVT